MEGGGTKDGQDLFDPNRLHDFFVNSIHQLQTLDKTIQGQVNKLEELCCKEEKEHKTRIIQMEDNTKVLYKIYFCFFFSFVLETFHLFVIFWDSWKFWYRVHVGVPVPVQCNNWVQCRKMKNFHIELVQHTCINTCELLEYSMLFEFQCIKPNPPNVYFLDSHKNFPSTWRPYKFCCNQSCSSWWSTRRD